jgi:hypothetical protein
MGTGVHDCGSQAPRRRRRKLATGRRVAGTGGPFGDDLRAYDPSTPKASTTLSAPMQKPHLQTLRSRSQPILSSKRVAEDACSREWVLVRDGLSQRRNRYLLLTEVGWSCFCVE